MKKYILNRLSLLALLHDIAAIFFAWFFAFLFRFNFDIPPEYYSLMLHWIWIPLVLKTSIFTYFSLYKGLWRFASLIDLKRIVFASISASIILSILFFLLNLNLNIPRSVLVLDPILLILIMGGSRFFYRASKEGVFYKLSSIKTQPIIIFGNEDLAVKLIKDLTQGSKWHVVSVINDDKNLKNREILGVKFQHKDSLAKIVSLYGVRHSIIAMPSAHYKERRDTLDLLKKYNLEVFTIPSLEDLIGGRVSVSAIKPVAIEDLLGREEVILDNQGLNQLIKKRVVMVSGAAGSIGSELCRQIIKFNPNLLICFDVSEYGLYLLEQEINKTSPNTKVTFIVGDIRNKMRLNKLLIQYKPAIVFHAAAYKHVPLMEHENVAEALSNNVFGTYTLANACKDANIDKFVLISTDKAVNPTNVMGATKRLAEMICQSLQSKTGTKFIMVRFGNVLGSSGSVIPKFREQIRTGGPVTVTHPDITRYFMLIPEAAQLVMQAGLIGFGGEIFVLDMGEPIRIIDLAKDLIKLSGLNQDEISIKFTGLRPGEKLYEELLADDDYVVPSDHKKIKIAKTKKPSMDWTRRLLIWINETEDKSEKLIKRELKGWVPEYTPYKSKTIK